MLNRHWDVTYYKSFHEMKDDKSAKTSATRNYPSAVVVNVSPSPPISFFHVSMTTRL